MRPILTFIQHSIACQSIYFLKHLVLTMSNSFQLIKWIMELWSGQGKLFFHKNIPIDIIKIFASPELAAQWLQCPGLASSSQLPSIATVCHHSSHIASLCRQEPLQHRARDGALAKGSASKVLLRSWRTGNRNISHWIIHPEGLRSAVCAGFN